MLACLPSLCAVPRVLLPLAWRLLLLRLVAVLVGGVCALLVWRVSLCLCCSCARPLGCGCLRGRDHGHVRHDLVQKVKELVGLDALSSVQRWCELASFLCLCAVMVMMCGGKQTRARVPRCASRVPLRSALPLWRGRAKTSRLPLLFACWWWCCSWVAVCVACAACCLANP